jgi:hypothetical protein
MLKPGFFILILFKFSLCLAQEDSITKLSNNHYNLKLSYLSSVIYPGASAGIEFPVNLAKFQRSIEQTTLKQITKYRLISANLNWYHHADFHDNVYITAEWEMRRTNNKGIISEFSFGPGFSRTFLGGTTYRMNDAGDISVEKLAGYNYALITIGGGFGIDLSEKKKIPFLAIAKMNLISMFPYNSTIYFRPVMELGIRYMLLQGTGKSNKN